MAYFRGGLNPAARLGDDLTPVFAAIRGGVFCRERLTLAPGPHTVRMQVQLPKEATGAVVVLTAATAEGHRLARAVLDTSQPDALALADAMTLSFVLEATAEVVIEGEASSHAGLTFSRFVTEAPVAAYEGNEALFRFHPALAEIAPRPRAVVFGTTAVCNANCFHCPTNKAEYLTHARGVMDLGLFERIVTELAELGFSGITIFGLFGEPFQDPHFTERLRIMRRLIPGALLHPSTNAALYDSGKHREALGLLDDIAVHIEGMTPAVYEASMRPLKAKRTFPRAEKLIEDRGGRPVRVVSPLHRRNLHEAAEMRSWWEKKGAGATAFLPLHNRAGQSPAYDDVALAPLATACAPDAMDDLFIDWDGKVLACCQDFNRRVVIGDLARESVREVMTGKVRRRMAEQLNEMKWNAIEICAGCRHDCPNAVNEMVAEVMKDGDALRRFHPREFQPAGPAERGRDYIRIAGRRSPAKWIRRPRTPDAPVVISGPHQPIHPGQYRIGFDLAEARWEIGGWMSLEVVNPEGVRLAHRRLKGSQVRRPVEVTVEIDRYVPMQFRLEAQGMSFDFLGVSAIRVES